MDLKVLMFLNTAEIIFLLGIYLVFQNNLWKINEYYVGLCGGL